MCKYLKLIPIVFIIIAITVKCNSSDSRNQPDISKISEPIPTLRLEQELYKIPVGATKEGIDTWIENDSLLMEIFIKGIMNISDTSKNLEYTYASMSEYLHHPEMINLNDTIQDIFKDFKKYEEELHLLMKNFKYYFPSEPDIKLFTYTSGFGPRSIYYSPYLGVGLDLYLGTDYKYYSSMGFPNFFIERLKPENIAIDAAINIIQSMREEPLKRGASLLDMMIYHGKIQYIASYLLPKRKIEDFLYYSKEDWQWCVDNEKEIWSFFLEGEWIFNKQYINYSKFIEDAPTTMGMPAGSPDRVGRWVGYQIVEKYMKQYPNTTFQELLDITSGQEILTKSKYKPSK